METDFRSNNFELEVYFSQWQQIIWKAMILHHCGPGQKSDDQTSSMHYTSNSLIREFRLDDRRVHFWSKVWAGWGTRDDASHRSSLLHRTSQTSTMHCAPWEKQRQMRCPWTCLLEPNLGAELAHSAWGTGSLLAFRAHSISWACVFHFPCIRLCKVYLLMATLQNL